jgi:predicted TIM-barrel fold metal-dependent hydrolase
LFGTDWKVIDPERAMSDIDNLNFREHSLRKILRDNAMKLFKLP